MCGIYCYVGKKKAIPILLDGLTSLEYRILLLLFQNLNRIVTRDILIDRIWDISGKYVNDNTLTVYIKRIREKLGNDNIIKTIKGIGYRVDK